MSCWNVGSTGFTFDSQDKGIKKKHAIGPTVNVGPLGQRYIVKANIVSGFSIRGVRYVWADYDGCSFVNESASSETEWQQAWNLGKYDPQQAPTGVTDPFDGTQTLIDQAQTFFTSSDNTTRNLILAAAAIALLTVVITINLK